MSAGVCLGTGRRGLHQSILPPLQEKAKMKWSELFSQLLGDKDIDISTEEQSQNISQDTDTGKLNTTQNQNQQPTDTQDTQTNSSEGNTFTQSDFNALNARIKELEEANKQLVLTGSARQNSAQSDEEIIYSLMKGQYEHGSKDNSTESPSATGNGRDSNSIL